MLVHVHKLLVCGVPSMWPMHALHVTESVRCLHTDDYGKQSCDHVNQVKRAHILQALLQLATRTIQETVSVRLIVGRPLGFKMLRT
jgi:hypothetical protein